MRFIGRRWALAAALTAVCSGLLVLPQAPTSGQLPAHPRLIFNPARIAVVTAAMSSPPTADFQAMLWAFNQHAAWTLTTPVQPISAITAALAAGASFLSNAEASRDVLVTMAAAHVLRTNASDTSYLTRAIAEAEAMCIGKAPLAGVARLAAQMR